MGSHTTDDRAGGAQAAVKLEHEEQVRQLRLAVGAPTAVVALPLEVVEVDPARAVRAAAHSHHPRVVSASHRLDEQAGEGEVAQVIGAELELEAVCGQPPRRGHYACI